jgi:exosome complex exonuclease RRP6
MSSSFSAPASDPPPTTQSPHDALTAALLATTRATNALCAEDIPFHRALSPALAAELDTQQAALLRLAEQLLQRNATGQGDGIEGRQELRLRDVDDVEMRWRGIVEVLDGLLERADGCLDEVKGLTRRVVTGTTAPAAANIGEASGSAAPSSTVSPVKQIKTGKVPRNLDILKPQLEFEHVPTNDESGPFKPLLRSKPHAIVSFEDSRRLGSKNSQTGEAEYDHPYATEIEEYSYPESVHRQAEPVPYSPFESTTATYVDTEEGLAEMLAELKQASEISVDLEHHDHRSYIGMVSLMQISTRNRDWIIDTLKPWRRRLDCLNEVFADPKILKVLHGAYSDILWLQRDLGIYVVGLFDTYHAARALHYQGASLAFLLMKFCNFEAQKQYQMADWRIR